MDLAMKIIWAAGVVMSYVAWTRGIALLDKGKLPGTGARLVLVAGMAVVPIVGLIVSAAVLVTLLKEKASDA